MQPARNRTPADGLEARLGFREWAQAVAALGLVLLGAAAAIGLTYWLVQGPWFG